MGVDRARNQVERFIGGNIENRFALEHQRQVGFTDDDAVKEARYFAIVFTQRIVHKGQYIADRNPGADGYQRAQDATLGCTHLATSVGNHGRRQRAFPGFQTHIQRGHDVEYALDPGANCDFVKTQCLPGLIDQHRSLLRISGRSKRIIQQVVAVDIKLAHHSRSVKGLFADPR